MTGDTDLKPWLNSSFPLHVLAVNGDPAEIEQLLMAGSDVNQEDFLSTRPLHVAALSNHIEAVKLFIEYGADVNDDSYYGITALHLAIMHENYDVAEVLLMANADPNIGAEDSFSPLLLLFDQLDVYIHAYHSTHDPVYIEKVETLCNVFSALGPDSVIQIPGNTQTSDYPIHYILTSIPANLPDSPIRDLIQSLVDETSTSPFEESFLQAKLFMHVFPTGNDYTLTVDGQVYHIASEGFTGTYTTDYISQSIHSYLDYLPQEAGQDDLPYTLFTKIAQTYELASECIWHSADSSTYELALNAYQQGNTVLLPSGWEYHFVDIILSEPQSIFASANSGQRYIEHEAGVTFYHMADPNYVDINLIGQILTNEDEMVLEYDLLYQYSLFENIEFLPGDNQNYGNCALQSHREAVRGLLYIELLNEGYSSEESLVKAEDYFQNWNHFLSEYTLDTFLEHNQASLPIDAYLDIFAEINFNHEDTLSDSDIVVSQRLLDAALTPDHETDFQQWVEQHVDVYSLSQMENVFQTYSININEIMV